MGAAGGAAATWLAAWEVTVGAAAPASGASGAVGAAGGVAVPAAGGVAGGLDLPFAAGARDRVLAAGFGAEPDAAVLDRPRDAVRAPALAGPVPGLVLAGSVPSAAPARTSAWAACVPALSWPAAAGLAARARLPVRASLTVPAGCLLAARRGAGPDPPPADLSPGIPFSEVTAP